MGVFFIGFLNKMIIGLGSTIDALVSILPSSPFQIQKAEQINDYIGYMNWVIPFQGAVTVLTLWCSCVLSWYIYQVAFRWGKVID